MNTNDTNNPNQKSENFLIYKKTMTIYPVVVFLVVFDRFLKILSGKKVIFDIWEECFRFNFTPNYFMSFSLPLGGAILLLLMAAATLWLLVFFLKTFKKDNLESVFLFSIILGAASNLYDRLVYGYVIDYFDLKYFTVFNLADCLIVGGAILFAIFSGKIERRVDKKG